LAKSLLASGKKRILQQINIITGAERGISLPQSEIFTDKLAEEKSHAQLFRRHTYRLRAGQLADS
jgi:hypothetical protein